MNDINISIPYWYNIIPPEGFYDGGNQTIHRVYLICEKIRIYWFKALTVKLFVHYLSVAVPGCYDYFPLEFQFFNKVVSIYLMAERMTSQIQADKMNFLRRVSGLSLTFRVKTSVIVSCSGSA